MKKSIFKRIVSTALALTMLASMAVGMSTSVSAATNVKPSDIANLRYSYDGNGKVVLLWNKSTNATEYIVRVLNLDNKDKTRYNLPICTINHVDAKYTSFKLNLTKEQLKSYKFDISVTPYNGTARGEEAKLYEYPAFVDWYRPCMQDVKKNTIEASVLKDNSITFNWANAVLGMELKDSKYPEGFSTGDLEHQGQGYQITLIDLSNSSTKIRTTGKTSYTFKNLTPNHIYRAEIKTFIIGYAGKMIVDIDTISGPLIININTKNNL